MPLPFTAGGRERMRATSTSANLTIVASVFCGSGAARAGAERARTG